jgi:hypothetical protein
MHRTLIVFIVIVTTSVLLAFHAFAQEADGTIRLNSRSVSPGIGFSWGDGVLTYKGQDYPFTFQAKGLFRDVDARITATELSGQVFNLKRLALFTGTYHKIEAETTNPSAGSQVTMKNPHGVIINLLSTTEGRKFVLGRDGMSIKLQEQKP